MDYIEIYGGKELQGSVNIGGAKNAALPILASTILSNGNIHIENLPNVVDIKTFIKLLNLLGSETTLKNNDFFISTEKIDKTTATYEIVKTMRASILVLGPLLARFGECSVSLPGGCAIGQRPVDLHLKALEQMGANIEIKGGYIHATAKNGLVGATIVFDKITVTGTENIIMAAALAKGKSKLINCAREPEVIQLCEILKDAGLDIKFNHSDEIDIVGTGGELLNFKKIRVIPDRIEAGTYLCAGAITNSEITLKNIEPLHIESISRKLLQMGFPLEFTKTEVKILKAKSVKSVDIITSEYPAFPTDMQAQFMALTTQANGTSIIEERLFENRFMHASELTRLGAKISLKGNIATIYGKTQLEGAEVMATDLRASSALVLAALCAKEKTEIHRIYHLDRGYEKLEEKLLNLGANIRRVHQ